MKPNSPPSVTTDPQGRITNFAEVARWAFCNDAAFHSAFIYADNHTDTYVARLERLVVVLVLTKHEAIQKSIEREMTRPLVYVPDPELTVTTPADAPDEDTLDLDGGSLALTLMIAAVSIIALALAAWGLMRGQWAFALSGVAIAGAGAGYLAWRGGLKS